MTADSKQPLSVDPKQLKREKIARRIVKEFPHNSLVNLGIGLPTLCANFLPEEKNVMLHSENGFTGLGPVPEPGMENPDLVNAGGSYVTILPGGAFFDSTMSFSIIRGGHLHATVLGALEVDQEGNLANYMIPGKMVSGMGGAMDLVVGARQVIIAMEHVNRHGEPKILRKCTLPLTAKGEVDLIVTEMAVIRRVNGKLVLEEIAEDTTVETVLSMTEAKLEVPAHVGKF